jgi:hypothetical protein
MEETSPPPLPDSRPAEARKGSRKVEATLRRLCLLLPMLLLPTRGLEAQRASDVGRSCFYAGGLSAYRTVGGEFTGDLYLSDGYQLIVVPEVGAGWGFGGLVGMRMPHIAQELSYTRSSHLGMWDNTIEFESLQQTVAWDFRIFPLPPGPLEPFALLGMGFLWLKVFDGITDGSTTVDAIYHGFSWDFGGGVSLGISKHASIAAQAVYRLARYNTVDDFWGINLTITDGLNAGGWDFSAMLLVSW